MPQLVCLLVTCAALFAGLGLPAQAAAPLKLVSDENAPFAFTDQKTRTIAGITTEMLAEAARRAGVRYSTALYPWARAFFRAQTDADTCVYPVARLPEREDKFQWVGPLNKNRWVLFARADFGDAIATLDDVRKYRVGGLLQDGPSVFLRSQGLSVDLVGANELNLNKLTAGRIDLWATGYYRGRIVATSAGAPLPKAVYVIKEVDHYLACNPKVGSGVIRELNAAVDAMWRDGWMKKTIERYQDD